MSVDFETLYDDTSSGPRLSKAEVDRLENSLSVCNDQNKVRCMLAKHYSWWRLNWLQHLLVTLSKSRWLPKGIKEHEKHALWIIGNLYSDPVASALYAFIEPSINPNGYALGRQIWLDNVAKFPDNVLVLRNAQRYLSYHEPKVALGLIEAIARLQPDSTRWRDDVARLYRLHGDDFERKSS
jgi:hypothetical protein